MTGAVEAAVEAAARALCDRNDGPPDWQPWTDDARAAVRAALEALAKNLTPEMVEEVERRVGIGPRTFREAWEVAIAAALKEGGG